MVRIDDDDCRAQRRDTLWPTGRIVEDLTQTRPNSHRNSPPRDLGSGVQRPAIASSRDKSPGSGSADVCTLKGIIVDKDQSASPKRGRCSVREPSPEQVTAVPETGASGAVSPPQPAPPCAHRRLFAVAILVALVGGCSSATEQSSDLATPTSTFASGRTHPADEPCENQRTNELGAPTPADDVYVDDEVGHWASAAPEEVGLDAAALESAVDDVGLSTTVLSLLVVRHGRLVVEEYFNGAEASHAHNIFSTTKILTTLAMGAAVDEGIVPGLDTTLGEWVEETAGRPPARVTLEQMLSMRSGLAADVANEPFSAEVVADAPLAAEPGTTYSYVTDNSELLALGLDRRAPDGLCRYLHERVLGPMGVSVDHWHETPYGNVTGGSYAFLTPRELARLGQLLLDEGNSAGVQLVPSAWIRSMTRVRTDFGCRRVNAATSTSVVRQGAGMGIGTSEVAGYDVWEAGGFGGQGIMVVPDLDVVVVITQEVGPVFERRLPILDVLKVVFPAVADSPTPEASPCPTSVLVTLNDGVEAELPVPAGGFSDWSPDGQQIAFSSSRNLNPELYLINADGTGLRRLTTDTAVDFLPRWSPDAMTLAFASDRGALTKMPLPEPDLWLLDVATGQTRPLTNGLGDVLGHSWSPNGDRIVFTRTHTEASPYGDLWSVDVATGDATLLAEGNYSWPEWSADGQNIAFVTERSGQPFVAYLDLDSNDHVEVAAGQFPRWSPDGRSMLMTRDDSIFAVNLDDGTETVVTEGCCVSVAPDSHRLVVSRER
jgi:CubicO group peptidase (beta-lactamase class C family)